MDFIRINDLARHAQALGDDVREAVERVVASGWYVLGPECTAFEREFADFCGVGHCVGVANGTDALELAFRVLGLGPRKRVATVANAGYYSTAALALVGAEPVYVDVEAGSSLMDLATLEELAKGRAIDAIVVTHLFGFMHDSGWAREISDAAGIPLIEDCAQAHGARHAGHMAGSVGHVGCFSFYPTKNLGAFGDGGAVVTSDPQIAERLVRLRQYGWEEKYRVQTAGGRNSRLDEMQAAVLRVKLPHLERWNERRQAIAARYSTEIAHPRIVVPKGRGEEYVAHLYVVQCGDRDGLRDYLAGHGILCDIHYPIPDHLQPACSDAPRPELPVTERLAKECLTLPCFPELTDDEVERIIDRINAW